MRMISLLDTSAIYAGCAADHRDGGDYRFCVSQFLFGLRI
jgi:hypothetical protein